LRSFLPDILFAVSERFGVERAMALATAHGGTYIYLPKEASEDHRLAASLGIDLLSFLIERHGSGELLIPLGPTSGLRAQQRFIVGMLRQGFTAEKIAGMAKCHVRTVHLHRAKLRQREATNQLSLFETPDIRPKSKMV
jgi:DNA-binding CsgD family transcriptional regulator